MKLWERVTCFKKIPISSFDLHQCKSQLTLVNMERIKFSSYAFLIFEVSIFLFYALTSKVFLWRDTVEYKLLYLTLFLSLIFLLGAIRVAGRLEQRERFFKAIQVVFATVILSFASGITILDQSYTNQVTVYIIALLYVSVGLNFELLQILPVFLGTHIVFLTLMNTHQSSEAVFFANAINTTVFLALSLVLICMRFRKELEDFLNRKLIEENQEKLEIMNHELEVMNRKLEVASQIDGLTGIYNRMMFEVKIVEEWNRCKQRGIPISMLMIDIDFFKPYNDHYGHRAGDRCIQRIAEVLRFYTDGSKNFVARYGGEEFAVVYLHEEERGAKEMAEKIRKDVEALGIPHQYSSIAPVLTISIGVYSVVPNNQLDIERFIELADQALYRAKLTRNVVAN